MEPAASKVRPAVSLIKKDAVTPRNDACTVMKNRNPQLGGEEV
ncbi:MAG TPA: hypothetical protein VJN89_13355 [Candidatus Acidoferrum sp.]|nr:hypothetical protein [Candidatus Acidoferrum sp.]